MPQVEPAPVLILLACGAVLLLLLLLVSFRIASRLSRIESLLRRQVERQETAESGPSVAETSPGGAFEIFLSEDVARRELSKAEQFGAYRRWRQEKGMNWSNS